MRAPSWDTDQDVCLTVLQSAVLAIGSCLPWDGGKKASYLAGFSTAFSWTAPSVREEEN